LASKKSTPYRYSPDNGDRRPRFGLAFTDAACRLLRRVLLGEQDLLGPDLGAYRRTPSDNIPPKVRSIMRVRSVTHSMLHRERLTTSGELRLVRIPTNVDELWRERDTLRSSLFGDRRQETIDHVLPVGRHAMAHGCAFRMQRLSSLQRDEAEASRNWALLSHILRNCSWIKARSVRETRALPRAAASTITGACSMCQWRSGAPSPSAYRWGEGPCWSQTPRSFGRARPRANSRHR
jgi:hypothetical protein